MCCVPPVCVCVSILLLQSINATCLCMLSVVIWPFVQSFPRKHKESIEQLLMAPIATSFRVQNRIFFPLLKDFSSKPWDRCKNRIKRESIFRLNSVLWSWRRPKWEYSTFFFFFFCYRAGRKPQKGAGVLVLLCFSQLLFIHTNDSRPYVFPRMWR